jgi:uncharacterized protein (TIGR03083 family)
MTGDLHAALPPALRDRVLAAARSARDIGRPLPDVADISPVEAFSRAADAFSGLLSTLPADAWHTPVLRDLDIQGLVGHLTGVEDDVQRALAGDPSVACADHIGSTQPAAERESGRSPADSRRDWRAAVERTLALVRGEDLRIDVAVHGMRLPLGVVLVVRAFELWTHENDIRKAAGRPPSVPDQATLRLMTGLAVRLLPHGVARVTEDVPPADLHLVLTGPGGGTWDVALGDRPGAGGVAELGIVADAVDFCRLVANRVAPPELGAHLTGATGLASTVFTGAAALALD